MYLSDNKRLFNLILTKLNENTQDVEFSGNYMFKFNQQQMQGNDFQVIRRATDSLNFEETEVVPLVDVQSIEVPYVQTNKQADWEREFYIAIKVPHSTDSVTNNLIIEFDETNPRYQAVLETLDTLKSNLTFVDGDYKYSFKVKMPTKVSVFKYNGTYYQILALTMNLTSLEKGYFGNETKIYFGLKSDNSFGETSDYAIDFREFNEMVAKTARPKSLISTTEQTYSLDKRDWEASITANFNGNVADMLLYLEKSAQADLDTIYQIKISNDTLNTDTATNYDYTFDVRVTSVNITYQNNIVDTITFKLQRA